MLLKSLAATALAAATFAATPASAVTLVSIPASTGELASPGSTSVSFNAAAGTGATDFILQGFRSLDGQNGYQDTFTLSLNGTDIFSGTFDLGGGGANVVFIPGGATYSVNTFGSFAGGEVTIHAPLALAAGANTLGFRYDGTPQGLGDEAWGIRALTVTGGTIPEPAAWALLVVGFAVTGLAARRRGTVSLAA